MESITLFATAAADKSSGGMFESLGIDWKIMILQAIAFIVLVVILAKWIYPPILAMLDRRDKLINDSVKAAKEATERSEKTAAEIEERLREARVEAKDIVSSAREQSSQMLLDSEKDAERRAESLVASAKAQLSRDVEAARKMLRDETASLVALATEKVVGTALDSTIDGKVIDNAISKVETTKKGAK